MTNSPKNQDPISQEDLGVYLNYILTGVVKDEKHAKELKRLSRRTVTVSDVTVMLKMLMQAQDHSITQVMDVVQIMQKVLVAMGATEKQFETAEAEYNEDLNKQRKIIEEQLKQNQIESPEKEEEASEEAK